MMTHLDSNLPPQQPFNKTNNELDTVRHFCNNHYLTQAYKRKRSRPHSTTATTPRWHNQSFMLYLALRHHTESDTMARTDLIKAALEWDVKLSQEHSLPRVFKGKTPMNSASAVLSNNTDGYFVPLRPEGSRSMHFKLSFEPGHFHTSWEQYQEWQHKLITMDWPHYFGNRSSESKDQYFCDKENLLSIYPTEFDEFLAKRKRLKTLESEQGQNKKSKLNSIQESTLLLSKREDNFASLETADRTKNDLNHATSDIYIPKSWKELFFVNNDGVFAKRLIPHSMPIGFYFGVPRTEDEFIALKEGRGNADEYAMLYCETTIIDPTDDKGNLYTDKQHSGEPICPFYYVKETSHSESANIVFCEGLIRNQIVCWTMKDIAPGEELYMYEQTATLGAINRKP